MTKLFLGVIGVLGVLSCSVDSDSDDESEIGTTEQALSWGTFPTPGSTTVNTPIGLAFEIDDGLPTPLRVRKGQRFYVNQIDLRAHVDATSDEGVAGLDREGDFAGLDWRDTEFVDESFVPTPNIDGTFTRRRMFRSANWMDRPSLFVLVQYDAAGRVKGFPHVVDTGLEQVRTPVDSFFTRRLRAIQWTRDCASKTDCSTADTFMEEALVELRYANGPNPSFKFDPATTELRVLWTANPSRTYSIPVQQITNPQWDYGFGIDLEVITPPTSPGVYAPGQTIDVRFTLRDGSGNRLHAPGTMPTFLDFLSGNVPAGIDYWDVTEPTMTYYRRKHKEKQMIVAINGPVQDTQTIHDEVDFAGGIFGSTNGAVVVARPAAQGFFGEAAAVPSWLTLLGVVPADAPVSDVVSFTLPADAQSGTYKIVMKARRSYLGEEIPRARVIDIQVGSAQPTTRAMNTGKCTSCHEAGGVMSRINHAISLDDRSTCTTCHGPLGFEPEGPVYVRSHFLHSRSNRFDAPLTSCKSCHLDRAGIQRTSKSACLSCHKSYPADHVAQFGPVVDMYIGGPTIADSFAQCTTSCHVDHPASGL